MIKPGYKANFNTLQRAMDAREVALLECTDKATGRPIIALCAVDYDGEMFSFVPLAKMFDGNPYDELDPPEPLSLEREVNRITHP